MKKPRFNRGLDYGYANGELWMLVLMRSIRSAMQLIFWSLSSASLTSVVPMSMVSSPSLSLISRLALFNFVGRYNGITNDVATYLNGDPARSGNG